jgi:undecaprenyl-diphosphatase
MTSPKRPLISMSAALIALVVALVIGVALGVVAAGDRLVPGDVTISRAVQRMDGTLAGDLANIGNMLGSTVWAAVAIALALVGAAIPRAKPEVAFLGALLVLRLLGTQIKPLFFSPRPTDDLVLITGVHHGTGYPSGHALTAATLALGLAVIAWRHIPSRRVAIAVIVVLIGLGLLVGWARIWSGAHWPSDVVGGYLFGVATVSIGVILLNRQIRAATTPG